MNVAAWRLDRFLLCLCLLSLPALADDPGQDDTARQMQALHWQKGPLDFPIGDKATLKVPDGDAVLGAQDTRKFLELNHNPAGDNSYLLASRHHHWFAVFEFDPVGYVKDDEKIDADALLASIKESAEASNRERESHGWEALQVVGWQTAPNYDREHRLLEWAVLHREGKSNRDVVNYHTRLLGRTGVMRLVLVCDPADLTAAEAELKQTLAGYQYVAGERYEEFRAGDHVAEIGLAALITGGAAAVAAKKGLFGGLLALLAASWKALVAAALGVVAWLRARLGRKPQ